MIDKLEVRTNRLNDYYETLGTTQGVGIRAARYEKKIDLREIDRTPAILLYKNYRSGYHKIILIGVSSLGYFALLTTIRRIVRSLNGVVITRIDVCVDFPGVSLLSFVQNLYLPRAQGFRIFKSRKGSTYYFQSSKLKTILAYEKAKAPNHKKFYRPGTEITRFEVQLKNDAVPFRRLSELNRYCAFDFVGQLEIRTVVAEFEPTKPIQSLARLGFQRMVHKYGLNAALKLFPSPHRAFLKRKFLNSELTKKLASIQDKAEESVQRWLHSQAHSPRSIPRRVS